jgi:hypothetical protein
MAQATDMTAHKSSALDIMAHKSSALDIMAHKSSALDIQSKINALYHLDKEERDLKASLKVVSDKVRILKAQLLEDIKEKNMQKRPFVIGDRMIKYKLVKDTESLTQRYLKQTLSKYFEDDEVQAKTLFDFIVTSRNTKYVEVLDVGARPATSTLGNAEDA